MFGHVSLLCLCLLFVSSRVQGGQENLPSTWTSLVKGLQNTQAQSNEGKEGADATVRMLTEQLSTCNSRTIGLQTKLDDKRTACEQSRRTNADQLATCNSKTIIFQARLDERKEAAEENRRGFADQLATLNSRLNEAQQKSITTSLNQQTLQAENLRLKQQLDDTTSNLEKNIEKLEGQLAVTTGDLKDKTLELQNMQSKNSRHVPEVTAVDLQSTANTINQEILSSKLEIRKVYDEIISTKSKIEAGFVKMTQEREAKYNGLQNKQQEILQVIESKTAKKSPENSPAVAVPCDMDKLGDRFYYFSKNDKRNWHDAQRSCRAKGLQLVSIESHRENQLVFEFKTMYVNTGNADLALESVPAAGILAQGNEYIVSVAKLIPKYGGQGMGWTWIGGTDEAQEGTWRWSGTGQTLTYSNWDIFQPDGVRNYNCLQMWHHGKWDDFSCSSLQSFICELEM